VEQHVTAQPLIAAIALEILPSLAQLSAVPPVQPLALPQLIRLPLLLKLLLLLGLPLPLRLPLLLGLPLPLKLPQLIRLPLLQPQPQQHHLEVLQLAMGPLLIPQRMLALPMVQDNKSCVPSRTPLRVGLHATPQLHTAARVEL
jgi:hypothetical protein